jgi:hypothetical protein
MVAVSWMFFRCFAPCRDESANFFGFFYRVGFESWPYKSEIAGQGWQTKNNLVRFATQIYICLSGLVHFFGKERSATGGDVCQICPAMSEYYGQDFFPTR